MSNVFAIRALTIAKALELYADTRMKANRMYTPTNMLNAANGITGKTYKRGEYRQAATDIREKLKCDKP